MRKFLIAVVCIVSINMFKADDINIIKRRIAQWHWNHNLDKTTIIENVKKWQETMKNDHTWEDVDYKNPTRITWTAYEHLRRLKEMTIAYTAPWSELRNQMKLFFDIHRGIIYWNETKPKSINWWWNEIEAPRVIGTILIMLDVNTGEVFPPSLNESLIQQMDYPRKNGDTGVNLADFDTHVFYSGLLKRNGSEIKRALDNIFSINKPTIHEGVQFDNSYAQHGIMLHIFGYGSEYLKVESFIGAMVADTQYAMKGEKLKILTDFVTKTLIPQIRGKYITHTSFGRQIARKDYTDATEFIPYFENLILIDPDNKDTYRNTINRIKQIKKPNFEVKEFQKHYWNTDFSFYQDKNYQFSIRLSSVFTQQAETDLNGENKKGGYRSIGSYSLLRNGDEYFNIYPIWDWKKLPGTTTLENASIPRTQYLSPGKSIFSGGVSSGKIGVSAYLQNQFDVKAKKSWFMFDGEIICLGNDISSEKDDNILTVIEQNFLKGKILQKNFKNSPYNYILHREIAYIFPKKTNIKISTEKQKGSWSEITELGDERLIEENVFKLWIDHGKEMETEKKYQYIIIPEVKNINDVKNISENFTIISQNDIHAVYKKSTQKLMIVFWEPSQIEVLGKTIKSDRACTIILENLDSQNLEFFISDPSRNEKEINLEFESKKISIKLPTEKEFAGSSVYYKEN